MEFSLKPIARIHSPFREKFGTPRQANIVPAVEMQLEFLSPFDQADAVRGLDQFSHLWLLFWFDQVPVADNFQPLVRPPRLGGNDKVGVFASRSPFRPNPIGLSLVELIRIESDNGVRLHLRGGDLVDGTPIIDIKPYVPYADSAENPRGGFAEHEPAIRVVQWEDDALNDLRDYCAHHDASLAYWRDVIEQTLSLDPRPAYHDEPQREYGIALGQFNIRFVVDSQRVMVTSLQTSGG